MIEDAGITGLRFGWILYCGRPGTAEEAMNWWMNISTSGHRQQILTPEYNYFGVGTSVSQNGTRSWSVIFQQAQQVPPSTPHFTQWQLIDNNPATVDIVADGNNLYQIHNNGHIWKYTGTPLTGWQKLDNNPATVGIVASGNNLYQIHRNGRIWKYTGTPLTGWQELDNNPATKRSRHLGTTYIKFIRMDAYGNTPALRSQVGRN